MFVVHARWSVRADCLQKDQQQQPPQQQEEEKRQEQEQSDDDDKSQASAWMFRSIRFTLEKKMSCFSYCTFSAHTLFTACLDCPSLQTRQPAPRSSGWYSSNSVEAPQ